MPDVVEPPPIRIDRASPRRPASRAATPVRLDSVQPRLYEVVQKIRDRDEALFEFCLIAAELTNAECAVYFRGTEDGALTPGPAVDVTRPVRELVGPATARIRSAAEQVRPKLIRTDEGLALIAVPVSLPDPQPAPTNSKLQREVICIALLLRDAPIEPFVISLQMIAAYITQWYEREAGRKLDWEAEAAAVCKWLIDCQLATTDRSVDIARLLDISDRAARQSRWQWINPLLIKIPLGNPEPIVERLAPWLGWLASGPMLLVWLAVCGIAVYQLFGRWDELSLESNLVLTGGNWLWLAVTWLLLKLLHELAHALVCRRFGGTVREAGLAFILFGPIP